MYECTTCGACCVNPRQNQEEGYTFFVEIDDERSALLTRKDLTRKYVILDEEGNPHIKLDPDGRCCALRGKIGARATCEVYAHRPRGCRLVTPGDAECLRAREEHGIEGSPLGPQVVHFKPKRR